MQLTLAPLQEWLEPAPQPFLKWAGGKSQLLPQMTPFLPKHFQNYHEPFLGGAALFWHLFDLRRRGEITFQDSYLSDANPELINCYLQVRDDVANLITELAQLRNNHCPETYYRVRDLEVKRLTPLQRAARFIYLNKTCYNGLYRVNRDGKFNVPMGRYHNPRIFDEEQLRQNSQALQSAHIECRDFRTVLERAQPGDFVYFDPPYAPLSPTSNFTSYTAGEFGVAAQRELAEVFRQLDRRGCYVMLSNSWCDFTLALYRDFHCVELKATRAINSQPSGRGKISELLVCNY
ncbi:MAG: DNA adenine methylase [Gloeomargarita sp. SKYB31]|nr:DNA adenine methylase [Gloeomargarita sp. SKYB31]